jgi:hypothetical protein
MATTSNTYTGNGTNKLFSITFPYLDTSDINVYLNGVLQTITTHFSFANATTVEFITAPGNGTVVRLDRSTDDNTLAATFFPGSSIKANDLNENFDQTLYVVQEINNNAVKLADPLYANKTYIDAQDATKVSKSGDSMSGALAMGGNKITGLGTTSNPADAATKQYVDDNALLYSGSPAFTQDGVGAVTRSWSSKLKEIVSVTDFGAVANCTGQGVGTDVIPAIKKAVDHLIANIGDGGKIILPPGRYRASTSEVLNLNGLKFVELDFQGVITPDSTAMTVLTIENAQSLTLKASIHEGGIFNGWLAAQPFGPCDYSTTRNAAAAGGQEMFLLRGLLDYTVELEAFSYAGRVLRTDERSNAAHPITMAIKGKISTRRNVSDLSKPRVAQSLWAEGGTANPNIGNWGSLDRIVCDFDQYGPVWNRLNDIEIGIIDAAFANAGPTFQGCIVVTGNIWYVGDTDGGAGSRHVQFVPKDGIKCSSVRIAALKFLNKGPGLYMEQVTNSSIAASSLGTNLGDVLTLIDCEDVVAVVSASGTGSRLCTISGSLTNRLDIKAYSNSAIFSDNIIDIASTAGGSSSIAICPWLVNQTASKSAIKVGGSASLTINNPQLSGTAGNIFDIASASNNVSVYNGFINTAGVTTFANGIRPINVIDVSGIPSNQAAPINYRSNFGGLSGGDGGAYAFGVGTTGYQYYDPMSQVKGLLISAAGTELQGDLALQIRPAGSAGQTLIDAITASATTTNGEITALVLARISGAYVAKRVKFGGTGTGPGGLGRALYIED